MSTSDKRMIKIQNKINSKKNINIFDAIYFFKNKKKLKFIESIDAAINLNIDSRKSDQNIKNALILPHSIGKLYRVAVFAQGENINYAKKAGADFVGTKDLYDKIVNGEKNFDVVIASPDTMKLVSKLGQILGPKGLMPNPKIGTVTDDIYGTVKKIKSGYQIKYHNDKNGIIHTIIGKVNFTEIQIKENLECLLSNLKKNKPVSSKGTFIKKVVLSSTMGLGLIIDLSSLDKSII